MSDRFDILETPLQGLQLIRRKPLGDSRGYLERMFCQSDLAEQLKGRSIVQINHTLTVKKGTLRGMHFQYQPFAETKFVMCLKLYFHTAAYNANAEAALNALDKKLAIAWPVPVTEQSPRDKEHPMINPDFLGVVL